MGKRFGLLIFGIVFVVTTLFCMDDEFMMKKQFDFLWQEKETLPSIFFHDLVTPYKKLKTNAIVSITKQLQDSSSMIFVDLRTNTWQKAIPQSFAHIKMTAEDLIKFQRPELFTESKNIVPSIRDQLLHKWKFDSLALWLLDTQKKVQANKPDRDIGANTKNQQKKIIATKKFLITTAVATISLLIVHNKDKIYALYKRKRDEKILHDFEIIMQQSDQDMDYFETTKEAKIRYVAERLIDENQEFYPVLAKRFFFYIDDFLIKKYIKQYSVSKWLMDRAIIASDWEFVQWLLKPDLCEAIKKIYDIKQCDFFNYKCPHFGYHSPYLLVRVLSILHKNMESSPDVFKSFLLPFKGKEHNHLFFWIVCFGTNRTALEYEGFRDYVSEYPEKLDSRIINAYLKLILPYITDAHTLHRGLVDLVSTFLADGHQEFLLAKNRLLLHGADPNVYDLDLYFVRSLFQQYGYLATQYDYKELCNPIEFINSRIQGLKLLIAYGSELPQHCVDFEDEKQKFLNQQIESLIDSTALKEKVLTALDEMKQIEDEEDIFRKKFFNHNDVQEKNHNHLFTQLNDRCPQSAGWWIVRVLKIQLGMYNKNLSKEQRRAIVIDPTLYDVQKIPNFCLQEINKILSPNWRPHKEAQQDIDEGIITFDQETKRALLQWKKLFCFLRKHLPDAFSKEKLHKINELDVEEVEKEKIKQNKECSEKQRTLGKLMLNIVEQGYYEKPKTYEFLCPIIDYCLELDTLPDITVQGDVEGSILHVLAMPPKIPKKNIEMLQKIIETYTLRDPFTLFCALASNIKRHNFKEEPSTPKQIVEKRLHEHQEEWCRLVGEFKKLDIDEEMRMENKAALVIIEKNIALAKKVKEIIPDIIAVKQRAIAHCPYV